ncbi:flavin reductase family protein [Pseudorhodoplanes sp.]|jgi:flavin reductase (DIM6/NTAB) family NADH-FMN oxidoreductase RutF|uniref:flavin reductase family protein n=1 Tax=Pseudorhodoplanes sp. TaxID=1934341 RepID=UPI002C18CBA4|nr:flavin reductase family protein [Pseudorhodoplanes sp.]HWV43545.1 flavin reductase family protein [Pseudorhodoplanes sp.]
MSELPHDLHGRFRTAMRRLTSAVSVISTVHEGVRHGITVTSVTSVSMTPPSLLFCVNRNSRLHDPVIRSGRFCVNILHAHQIEIADAFSGRTHGSDRFLCGEWASDDNDTPYLIPAQANIFCEADAISSYGTHSIVIGKVLQVAVRGQVAPLLYQDGQYTVGLGDGVDWVVPVG